MRVTVCELPVSLARFPEAWAQLCEHTQSSDLVLLPELPFYPWIGATRDVNPAEWQRAVDAHLEWLTRLPELGAKIVIGSRPVMHDGLRLNSGFVWTPDDGPLDYHDKAYLPDEPGFWEASWYARGPKIFEAVPLNRSLNIGFMICSELWFMEHAREYAEQGVHLLVTPRCTEYATFERWLVGGRAAALIGGAYSLSSNHSGEAFGNTFGGAWIVDPSGQVLGTTSPTEPFRTVEIDLSVAEAAKQTYPRYLKR